MPAAAVIPAPIAYMEVVAHKKLVVGSRQVGGGPLFDMTDPFVCVSLVKLGGYFLKHGSVYIM